MNIFGKLVLLLVCWVDATFSEVLRTYTCGDQSHYTEDNGVIVSHMGFYEGREYGKNLGCVWKIEAPEGMYVQLIPEAFSLEDSTECGYDSLELFDGNSVSSPRMGLFCGEDFYPITSTQRYLTLAFYTDQTQQYTGFKFFYNFTTEIIQLPLCVSGNSVCDNGKCISDDWICDHADDCGDDSDETTCNECIEGRFNCSNGLCVPMTWKCDGSQDCGDGSDEEGCPTDPPTTTTVLPEYCVGDGYRNETNGTLTSPDYPSTYPHDVNCVVTIDVGPDAEGIIFTFDDVFELESAASCMYDYVKIVGEPIDGHEQMLGPYCDDVSPGTVNITGQYAEVTFHSDGTVERLGYSLEWVAYP